MIETCKCRINLPPIGYLTCTCAREAEGSYRFVVRRHFQDRLLLVRRLLHRCTGGRNRDGISAACMVASWQLRAASWLMRHEDRHALGDATAVIAKVRATRDVGTLGRRGRVVFLTCRGVVALTSAQMDSEAIPRD